MDMGIFQVVNKSKQLFGYYFDKGLNILEVSQAKQIQIFACSVGNCEDLLLFFVQHHFKLLFWLRVIGHNVLEK